MLFRSKELAELTTRLDSASARYGMEISSDKSKVLSTGVDTLPGPNIMIGGVKLEEVTSFRYLRARITEDGRSDTKIKARIATATGALAKPRPVWQSNAISTKSKIRLLRAIVISMALYDVRLGC